MTNREKVVEEAKRRIRGESWFKGVCVNHIPNEQDCEDNFEHCVNQVILETEMWDNPDFLKEKK